MDNQAPKDNKPTETKEQQEEREHDRLLAAIVRGIAGMTDYALQCVYGAVLVEERDQGCTTPAEELLDGLLYHYCRRGALKPENVENALGTFRENFVTMLEHARLVASQYPDLLMPKPPAEPERKG